MTDFRYIAARQDGQTVRGSLSADSVGAASLSLDEEGLIPLRLEPVRTLADWRRQWLRPAAWTIEEKILFTQKLASLLKAGIPILTVLDLINKQIKNPDVAMALGRVADQVAAGTTLTDAMSGCPHLFDPVTLGAVRAGEATGRLDTVLDQTAAFLEREMITRRQVKETLRYPIMVIVAMVLASTVILKFVVPRFLDFYTHFGSKLPLPTRLLMAIAGVIGHFWWVIPFGSVGIGLWWWRWTKTPSGEHWRDRMILRLPLVGILFLKVSVSRFARLFGVLFSAGVPATSALDTVRLGVGNVVVAEEIDAMRHRLTTGGSVSSRPSDAVMPELVYQMLGIGFESGDVERMMAEVARHYEQEISYDVRRLTDRLQPILLAVLASGVLLLALSVLLPMWNLISLFRQ